MRAAECGHAEVIEALLDMGADPNLQQDKVHFYSSVNFYRFCVVSI